MFKCYHALSTTILQTVIHLWHFDSAIRQRLHTAIYRIDWLMEYYFTPYRQYFRHMTMIGSSVSIKLEYSTEKNPQYPDKSHSVCVQQARVFNFLINKTRTLRCTNNHKVNRKPRPLLLLLLLINMAFAYSRDLYTKYIGPCIQVILKSVFCSLQNSARRTRTEYDLSLYC